MQVSVASKKLGAEARTAAEPAVVEHIVESGIRGGATRCRHNIESEFSVLFATDQHDMGDGGVRARKRETSNVFKWLFTTADDAVLGITRSAPSEDERGKTVRQDRRGCRQGRPWEEVGVKVI